MKNTSTAIVPKADNTATLTVHPAAQSLTVQQVLEQVALIQQIMGSVMKENTHYGKIPGCGDKPTLLKPGAEKLCLTFRLAPTYDVRERLLDGGHREYSITCTLTSIITGAAIGQGVGFGSTMESKYRFRKGEAEPTDRPVPRAYWDVRQDDPVKAQELIGGKGFSVKKVDGKGWMIARGGEMVENTNPANETNTVLKMTKKRALVDAVLTATAASDLMTQDLEDITANLAAHTPAVAADDAVASTRVKSGAPATGAEVPLVSVEAEVVDEDPHDFRETRIHFGQQRGLMLSELTPSQIDWLENTWIPKKEVNGPMSVKDLALINAVKAYREWRTGQPSSNPPKGGQASARPKSGN